MNKVYAGEWYAILNNISQLSKVDGRQRLHCTMSVSLIRKLAWRNKLNFTGIHLSTEKGSWKWTVIPESINKVAEFCWLL